MKIGTEFGHMYLRYGKDAYKKAKAHGFDCVDFGICCLSGDLMRGPLEKAQEYMYEQKALADEAGIEFSQTHGSFGWFLDPYDEEKFKDCVMLMKRSVEMTAALGCKNVVLHPFAQDDMSANSEEKKKMTWDFNAKCFEYLLKTARELDVTICFENMPFTVLDLSYPETMLEFVKYMNDDHFKICLDTGHLNCLRGYNLGEVVRSFGDNIRVLHVHDNVHFVDGHALPLMGTIQWKEFMGALKDIKFDGVFSMELRYSPELDEFLFDELASCAARISRYITEKF